MYEEYLAEVKVLRSKSTYETYTHALKKFPNGTKNDILSFLENDLASTVTKKTYLIILGGALEYYDMLTKDIKTIIKSYRANESIEPCPTSDEVETIWNSLRNSRDRLIFSLMAYNGLRVSEVHKLRLDDFLSGNRILLRDTKGKRDVVIPVVHRRVLESFQQYSVERKGHSPHLLISSRGTPLTLGSLKEHITRICRANGLGYHPHSFRRYFANTLAKNGVGIQIIKEAMRHKSIETTMRYMNIDQSDVKNALQHVYG